MDVFRFLENNLVLALFVFARLSGVFVSAPVFSSRNIPTRVKILLTFSLTLVLLPLLMQNNTVTPPSSLFYYVIHIFLEFLVGASVGLIMSLFFAVIQVAGQMLDTQVGFGIVNVVDPQSGLQMPLLGNFIQIIFTLVFFTADLHHVFLTALFDSFTLLPINHAAPNTSLTIFIIDLFAGMFLTAFRLAMPMIMAALLVDVSMGMLARTMPQMNVFVVGIPLKIAVGIFMLGVFMPTYIYILKAVYNGVSENIRGLLTIFAQ
jgi:flagellar biosynthetic protein FliR